MATPTVALQAAGDNHAAQGIGDGRGSAGQMGNHGKQSEPGDDPEINEVRE